MGKLSSRILIYILLTLGLSFTLLPFIMMILSSFKTNVEVLRVPPTFWPENFTLENYVKIFNDPKLPLLRFYGNSAFVATLNVVSALFTSSLEMKHQTLEEVGAFFNVTRERIRQVEAKALRKLRHPKRCKKLKTFSEK